MSQVRIKSHRDLIAWQKAMDLVVIIYEITKSYPYDERYGLTSQIRKSANSIAANIAEGQGRRSKTEFRQFLGNARGSLLELDSHMELSFRLRYIDSEQHSLISERISELGRIINGLMRSLVAVSSH